MDRCLSLCFFYTELYRFQIFAQNGGYNFYFYLFMRSAFPSFYSRGDREGFAELVSVRIRGLSAVRSGKIGHNFNSGQIFYPAAYLNRPSTPHTFVWILCFGYLRADSASAGFRQCDYYLYYLAGDGAGFRHFQKTFAGCFFHWRRLFWRSVVFRISGLSKAEDYQFYPSARGHKRKRLQRLPVYYCRGFRRALWKGCRLRHSISP